MRYVVVGGLATVLQGFARLTANVDLVLDPSPDAARKGIEALNRLGFRPRAPVDAVQFADPSIRSLAASPAERLAWLEEMIRLAFQTGALPRPKP